MTVGMRGSFRVGDGIAIEPEEGLVVAPCAGRVVQVHRSKHAYGILAPTGAQVLVHVGLETVELKGEGFSPRVREGQEVREGQPLVEFDWAVLKHRGMNPLTVMVVENMDEHPVSWGAGPGSAVRGGIDRVLRLGADGPEASRTAPTGRRGSPGRRLRRREPRARSATRRRRGAPSSGTPRGSTPGPPRSSPPRHGGSGLRSSFASTAG